MSFAGLPLKLSRESRVLSPVNCFPPDVLEANAAASSRTNNGKASLQWRIPRSGTHSAARLSSWQARFECDSRPLAEAVVGTWNNKLMAVTFSCDGKVKMIVPKAIE